jgi:hypothetical protein
LLLIQFFFNRIFFINKDSGKTRRLVREAKERLQEQYHPDPYIVPYMPGGTLFMRNPALPLEALYPNGIPEGYSRYSLTVFWVH